MRWLSAAHPSRGLRFTAYAVTILDDQLQPVPAAQTDFPTQASLVAALRAWGFRTNPNNQECAGYDELAVAIETLQPLRSTWDEETDLILRPADTPYEVTFRDCGTAAGSNGPSSKPLSPCPSRWGSSGSTIGRLGQCSSTAARPI